MTGVQTCALPISNRDIARRAFDLSDLTAEIARDEIALGLDATRAPDPDFFSLARAWAAGEDLDDLLGDEDLPGGDFVRSIRQLIDLLRQISETDSSCASVAGDAADALNRGIVAVSGQARVRVDEDPPEIGDPIETAEVDR